MIVNSTLAREDAMRLRDSHWRVDPATTRDCDLSALHRAAASLDEHQSPGGQPDVVERFFSHAADILRRLDKLHARPLEV